MKNVVLTGALFIFLNACSTEQIKWVAIGDSITYLNDHTDETGNRVTKGYMTLVAEELTQIDFVNKGFNGWTATDVAGKINDLGLSEADLYTIFLGTNDWWRGTSIGTLVDYTNDTGNTTFFGSFRIIIDKLNTLNPDARIILLTPMQRVDFVYIADMKNNAFGCYKKKDDQFLSEFADAVLEIAEYEKLEVVDLYHDSGMTHENLVKFKRLKDPGTGVYKNMPYPEFIDIPFNPETDEYPYPPEAELMTYDGLHPSNEGYKVIARMLVDKIN